MPGYRAPTRPPLRPGAGRRHAEDIALGLIVAAYLAVVAVLAWSAWRGDQTERLVFGVNLIALWASAVWLFGYPALIIPALAATAAVLSLIVVATAGDSLFSRQDKA